MGSLAAAPGPKGRKAGPPPRWPRFEETQTWQPVAQLRRSSHFYREGDVEIRVNPAARAAFVALVAGVELDVGTIATATHRYPGGERSVYAMEKTGPSAWLFWCLDATGRQTDDDTYPCQRCHAEAPADWLFPAATGGS